MSFCIPDPFSFPKGPSLQSSFYTSQISLTVTNMCYCFLSIFKSSHKLFCMYILVCSFGYFSFSFSMQISFCSDIRSGSIQLVYLTHLTFFPFLHWQTLGLFPTFGSNHFTVNILVCLLVCMCGNFSQVNSWKWNCWLIYNFQDSSKLFFKGLVPISTVSNNVRELSHILRNALHCQTWNILPI